MTRPRIHRRDTRTERYASLRLTRLPSPRAQCTGWTSLTLRMTRSSGEEERRVKGTEWEGNEGRWRGRMTHDQQIIFFIKVLPLGLLPPPSATHAPLTGLITHAQRTKVNGEDTNLSRGGWEERRETHPTSSQPLLTPYGRSERLERSGKEWSGDREERWEMGPVSLHRLPSTVSHLAPSFLGVSCYTVNLFHPSFLPPVVMITRVLRRWSNWRILVLSLNLSP